MTRTRLTIQSLRWFWRTHAGVLLGATLAAAILIGALAVGDSVRYSLRRAALERLGDVQVALVNPGQFFRAALGGELADELKAPVAAVAYVRGAASGQRADGTGGEVRLGRVQVLGVDDAFWKLGKASAPNLATNDGSDGAAINDRLAAALGVKVGDEVLLRVDKPSLLSRDAPLSKIEDATVALRLTVTAIVDGPRYGRFSLEANQVPPHNVFVARSALQKAIGMEGRANILLVGGGANPETATRALWAKWALADAGLTVRDVPGGHELRTERVFLDPSVGDAAVKAVPGARGVLTYFVNALSVGGKSTPYSAVAALDAPWLGGQRDDEIVINQWLADDLGAKVGDTLTLKYWLVGPMRKLEEHASAFRVSRIIPLDGPARDPDLMPDIPGLSDKKDCREWEPGVPIDLDKIRDKDQAYWTTHRGTPKAFLTLAAGRRIWHNRFGDLTAVRYPKGAAVDACLHQALSPASLGLFFQPVRERALAASAAASDFGGLFLAFSVFLIVAALLLTALLFGFGVEQRAPEVGLLLALGFTPRAVRAMLLREGAALALLGGVLGAGLATLYTRAVVGGLAGVWSGAVSGARLEFHAEPSTLVGGALGSAAVALAAVWLVARRQGQAPARALLSGAPWSPPTKATKPRRTLPGVPTALVAGVAALGMVGAGAGQTGEAASGMFFGAGAALLTAGLAACRALLARLERASGTDGHLPSTPVAPPSVSPSSAAEEGPMQRGTSGIGGRWHSRASSGKPLNLSGLGVRNSVRRAGRSLAAVALLACGSFLVVAVGAMRQNPAADAARRGSGTGGFAFYGEAALPIYEDLNAPSGREPFGLDDAALKGVDVLPMRLREGDDASCLNLNKPQTPRLLGVAAHNLAERGAFTFTQSLATDGGSPWRLLDRPQPDGAIPAVGDMNTVVWSLGKGLGATLPYTDERGAVRQVRIVGVLANAVLQGGLLVSEENFVRLFPGQSGYQVFLIDAPASGATEAGKELTRGLEDVGFTLTPAVERLAAFHTVEDTYLSIFAALGGLGLLLGSAGLGVVVLRNVLERRSEWALLRAVGLTRATLHRLVLIEHVWLLALGLLVGIVAALAAAAPALRTPGAHVPVGSLGLTLLAVAVSGVVWTALAAAFALKGPLLDALRSE